MRITDYCQHRVKKIAGKSLTYEKAIADFLGSMCLFIRTLSQSNQRNFILHKHVAHYSGNHSDGIDLGTEMWIFK